MEKILLFFGLSAAIMCAGCSQEDLHTEEPQQNAASGAQESANLHLLDQELEDISAEEWESIHLSKTDFEGFLSGMTQENEQGFQEIAEVAMKSANIRIVLNNSEGETLDNLLSAPFLDAKVRQAYLQSAYFDGQQPTIQITDADGTVLSDAEESLNLVKP